MHVVLTRQFLKVLAKLLEPPQGTLVMEPRKIQEIVTQQELRISALEGRIVREMNLWLGDIRAIKQALARIRELTVSFEENHTPEYLKALTDDDLSSFVH